MCASIIAHYKHDIRLTQFSTQNSNLTTETLQTRMKHKGFIRTNHCKYARRLPLSSNVNRVVREAQGEPLIVLGGLLE
jgi:hypothetical protein